MTNAITYTQLLNSVMNLCVDEGPSDSFTAIFPQAIQYCESTAYRMLDFLGMRVVDNTTLLVNGTRTATLPVNISVVEGISVFTPVGFKTTRANLERVSLDYLDFSYPTDTTKGVPVNYAMQSDTVIAFGPVPNGGYYIEVTGTLEPAPMSNANQTTILGNLFPDLMLSGTMAFMSAWQRDNGGSASPGDSDVWNSTFNIQMKTAQEFVQRQKSQSPNWTPYSPTPLSTPRT